MAVIKVLEIMSDSTVSWEDAVQQGIAKVSETVRNIRSAYVKEHSVTVENGRIRDYRVNLKITFEIDA